MPRKILEPFQLAGARALAANRHHLLADEPGLGKTLQAIAAAEMVGAKEILVCCPASVRINWDCELSEWFGGKSNGVRWDVISYEGAGGKPGEEIRKAKKHYRAFIPDEAHFLKNLEARRTHAVLGREGLARLADYVWPLTGTPVLNRPIELYPLLKTLHPVFRDISYNAYAQRYCAAYYDGQKMNARGASRLAELAQILAPFITRRTKRQVFPDRKAPIISRVMVKVNDRAATSVRDAADVGDVARTLRLLGLAKLPAIIAFVKDQLEVVEKVAVYAYHRDVIAALASEFDAAYYVGGMSDAEKQDAIKKFQTTSRVFVGQRVAAGVGINGLQRVCSTVVIAEPSWVPGETEQIIDRFDRIGQAEEIVNAYLLYAADSLDSYVRKVHDRKKAVVEGIVGGAAVTEFEDHAPEPKP
jgi:SWI/SNF-related matrix-associated actin-dependent regulator 1 of chromatin subfamily A